ncbi:MAG: hypothetical protein ACRDQ4_00135 [Pseudonocardiaceae bacterium]
MSWLDFISRMTGSLAWPLATVVGVLVLRQPITNLLAHVPLKRIKAGPFEVEIDRSLAEAETTLEAGGVIPPPVFEGSISDELSVEAVRAPAVAILEAHHAVERELRDMVASLDIQAPESVGAVRLARLAAQAGAISEESFRAVEAISVLRNLIAHGGAREVTKEQAQEYLTFADGVLFAIRENRRKHGS